jgi:ribosomal peptide maturation radical SAM protein 1
MYRVALVNMPFAAADTPSIALTQLKAVLERELGDRVECEVLYPHLDFVGFVGPQLYEIISNSVQANTSGLGDWFFAQLAFPEQPDNSEAYLVRHFSEHRAQFEAFRGILGQKRKELSGLFDRLVASYRLDRFSLVGFTSMFSQNLASIAMARRLKEIRPSIVTVMGGANCESPMGEVLTRNVPWVDYVFSGPALKSFPRLVGHLVNGEQEECHRIRGVFSRQRLAAGKLERMEAIGEELDISVDVPLDYDDYFAAFDAKGMQKAQLQPKVPFETSRGCWWGERSHCTFCGLNGATMSYRALPADQARRLLHGLFEKYSPRVTEFQSVDNILPREYLTEVLPELETPEGASLFYEVKADLKEREIAALVRARVTRIQPGIEALSTTTLKLMKKGTTSFQNLKFLKNCLRYGVEAYWNLLIGFPGEPEAVYEKYYADLPLFTHLQPPSGAFPVRFDRFSPYYTQAKSYGLKLKVCEFYEMIYPFPAAELSDLAYFFINEDYDAAYIASTARWVGKLRERVGQWYSRWQQRDGLAKPELTWKEVDGRPIVRDTRSGTLREHALSPAAAVILETLEEQHRVPRLAEKLDIDASAVQAEVDALVERGLLFAEGDMYMSLVVKPKHEILVPLAESREDRGAGLGAAR